jgi:hypothetical protein
MSSARVLLLATLLVTSAAFAAHAHSWYPEECCSDHDCMLADRIDTNAAGNRIVIVGRDRIWRGLSARSSPDGRIHICLRLVGAPGDISTIPVCLFMPPQLKESNGFSCGCSQPLLAPFPLTGTTAISSAYRCRPTVRSADDEPCR